jgi:hypothetical protein
MNPEVVLEFQEEILKNYLDCVDAFTRTISDRQEPSKQEFIDLDAQYPITLQICAKLFSKEEFSYAEFKSLFSCVEIMCNITSHISSIKDKSDLLDLISKMFIVIEKKTVVNEHKYNNHIYKQTGLLIRLDGEESQEMFYGYQCNLIRLLGNISYKNKEMQDLMRKLEFIPLIMKKSGIDFENPYMQEWCVVAIRNLTENNEENQEEIKKYRPIDVDPHSKSMAQKMGYDINLEDSERVKVTKL